MKFDVVIGNPPYNNDLYLDFVQAGYEALKPDGVMVMITPAKWQAKGGRKNEDFRANIVPHMKEIVYYPDALGVFPGTAMHGDAVCYYYIDKQVYADKIIDKVLRKNWDVAVGFDKNFMEIIDKVKTINSSTVMDQASSFRPCKSYFTSMGSGDEVIDNLSPYIMRNARRDVHVTAERITHKENMDKYKVFTPSLLTDSPKAYICEPYVTYVRQSLLLGFGSKERCESIQSYYQTKLIWYIIRSRDVATSLVEAMRFVPDPGAFDHIFTDAELYQKYGLTQDEINIIESVIKERK